VVFYTNFFIWIKFNFLYFFTTIPSLKIARRCQFFRTTGQFYRLKISTILNNFSFNKILSRIKKINILFFNKKILFIVIKV
jgi:hypothetical protein